MSAVFIPPSAPLVPPVLPETRGVQRRLFRHYGPWPRGLSVVFRNGHYVTVQNPLDEELQHLTDGVTYFLGGHNYIVDDDIAALLIADGFTVTDEPTPPLRQLTWGAVAGGTWSEFRMNWGTWG